MAVDRANVLRCDHRTFLSADDYWLGLDLLLVTVQSPTVWYNGDNSTYRNWARGEPNEATICITYTNDGFKDRPCDSTYHFSCMIFVGKAPVSTAYSI